MRNEKKTYLVTVAGASGSGKTTVVKEISKLLYSFDLGKHEKITLDDYYNDLSHLTKKEREKINFDHPNSLNFKRLINDLKTLIYDKKPVKVYKYNFSNHTVDKDKYTVVNPADVIFVEGILLFTNEEIKKLSDLKIYVETDLDICLTRRLQRDIKERGRDLDSVLHQYYKTVKPMYEEFIFPSKKYANIIIPEGGHNKIAIDIIVKALRDHLGN